jgi:hypothetical protein
LPGLPVFSRPFRHVVLPLIPMVLGAAVGERRHGAVALAAGLAVSFVAIGIELPTTDEIVASQQKLMLARDVVSSDGRVRP